MRHIAGRMAGWQCADLDQAAGHFKDTAAKIQEEHGPGSFNLTPWNRWVWEVATLTKSAGWGMVRDLTNRRILPWQAELLRTSVHQVWGFNDYQARH